jgi:hypothetical protein
MLYEGIQHRTEGLDKNWSSIPPRRPLDMDTLYVKVLCGSVSRQVWALTGEATQTQPKSRWKSPQQAKIGNRVLASQQKRGGAPLTL